MKLMTIYRRLLRESDEEDIQMYLDVIADNPNSPSVDRYKDILKVQYGVDWESVIKDDEYLNNVDLNNIKDKSDFRNWDTYIKYAKAVYAARKLVDPKLSVSVEIPLPDVSDVVKPLGITTKFKPYSWEGNYAQHRGGVIEIPDPCDVGTLVHELGHAFDELVYKDGISKKNTNASSSYMIGNVGEVFAENFMHYFLAPVWLKQNLPVVYNDLDSRIPASWKSVIRELLKYKS